MISSLITESMETEDSLDVACDNIAMVLARIKEFPVSANGIAYNNSPSGLLILQEVEDSDSIAQSFGGNSHECLAFAKTKEKRPREELDMYRKRRRCPVPYYVHFGQDASNCPVMGDDDDLDGDVWDFCKLTISRLIATENCQKCRSPTFAINEMVTFNSHFLEWQPQAPEDMLLVSGSSSATETLLSLLGDVWALLLLSRLLRLWIEPYTALCASAFPKWKSAFSLVLREPSAASFWLLMQSTETPLLGFSSAISRRRVVAE